MVHRLARAFVLLMVFLALAGASGYLTLSLIVKSEETMVVPDLIGLDAKQASINLSSLGLNTEFGKPQHHARIPKDHIFDQNPAPGTEIKKKRIVHLTLSLGAKQVPTPELIGLSLTKARIRLAENELCIGDQARVYGHQPNPDTVLAQAPAAGRLIRTGRCVDLLLSLGMRPELFKMPDMGGFSVERAVTALTQKGLSFQIEGVSENDHSTMRVTAQHPPAGYAVTSGTSIRLTAKQLTAGAKTDADARKPARVGLYRFQVPAGFLRRHIRLHIDPHHAAPETAAVLFEDHVRPGRTLWFFIPRGERAVVSLYMDNELVKLREFD